MATTSVTETSGDHRDGTPAPGAHANPTVEPWDARPGGRARALIASPVALVWAMLHMAWLLLLAVALPSRVFQPRRQRLIRSWGSAVAAILGIRFDVRGGERLDAPGASVVMFNHRSVLDIVALAKLWPRKATVLYKKEFRRVPIMGRLMRALDFIEVDRSNRSAAVASLEDAAQRVRTEQMQILIAPEGTRSRVEGLQSFKRGPFHLAVQSHAPAVPFIIRGVGQLMPRGSRLCRSGRIRVDVLPPTDTSGWSVDSLDEHARAMREVFLAYVPAGPGT